MKLKILIISIIGIFCFRLKSLKHGSGKLFRHRFVTIFLKFAKNECAMENVYIRIVPLKDKKSKKTNEIPLCLRIRNKEGKREFNLNINISDQQCELWDPFLDNVRENYSDLFNKINEINQKIGFVKDEIKLFRFPNDLERIKSYFIQTNQTKIQRWKDFYYTIIVPPLFRTGFYQK